MLLTLIIQKTSLQCVVPTSQAQCSHSFLAKDEQKNNKYYITQYYYLGVFVNVCTPCQLINLIFHGVQKLCWLIIEPEWSTRVTGDLLYITLFFFFGCCYCLFVVCNALCHFKFILLHVCYSSLKKFHFDKRSAYF